MSFPRTGAGLGYGHAEPRRAIAVTGTPAGASGRRPDRRQGGYLAGRARAALSSEAAPGTLTFIMRSATLVGWLITASLGAFMLRTWLARGGLSRERAKPGGLPPQLIFGHAAAAITGLLIWAAFLASGARLVAWAAVGLLMTAIGLGLCTVTLWTPYPARKPGQPRAPRPGDRTPRRDPGGDRPGSDRPGSDQADGDQAGGDQAGNGPAEEALPWQWRPAAAMAVPQPDDLFAVSVTDEMIARLLAEPVRARRPRPVHPDPAVLIPVAHGFAAIGTFVLAVMSSIT